MNGQTEQRKKDMIEALTNCLGIVSHACEKTGVGRTTHYEWLDSDPDYKAAVLQSKRGAVDLAESTLHKAMQQGDKAAVTAAIFILKTLGKDQGYIERQEIITNKPEPGDWFED